MGNKHGVSVESKIIIKYGDNWPLRNDFVPVGMQNDQGCSAGESFQICVWSYATHRKKLNSIATVHTFSPEQATAAKGQDGTSSCTLGPR
jgi:hypothetical protein